VNNYRQDYLMHYGVKGMKWRKHKKKMINDYVKVYNREKKAHSEISELTYGVQNGKKNPDKLFKYDNGTSSARSRNIHDMIYTDRFKNAKNKKIRDLDKEYKSINKVSLDWMKKFAKLSTKQANSVLNGIRKRGLDTPDGNLTSKEFKEVKKKIKVDAKSEQNRLKNIKKNNAYKINKKAVSYTKSGIKKGLKK